MTRAVQKLSLFSRIAVRAEREVAFDSPDHLMPWGTMRDSSRNRLFNAKLYALFRNRFRAGSENPVKVLDLGCSGGGFVSDCLKDGCIAVGLEGSDYSKKHKRGEWLTIPEFLFTCDITKNFDVFAGADGKEEPLMFDMVTSWEVMEHISDSDIAIVAKNVKKHLAVGGLWVMSVSPNDDIVNGVNLHQTVQPKAWWIAKMKEAGLEHVEAYVDYFNTQFVRGPKYGAAGSFHLIVTNDRDRAPEIPAEAFQKRLYDRWIGSNFQKLLLRWLVGP